MASTYYSDEEIRRMLTLRAIEWAAWPTYVTQPIVPILFIFYQWYFVLFFIFIVGVPWCLLRYHLTSFHLATLVVPAVVWLKWPAAIGSSVYLFIHDQYVAGIIAILYPLIAGFIGIPGKVGVIELSFAKQLGYVDKDATL